MKSLLIILAIEPRYLEATMLGLKHADPGFEGITLSIRLLCCRFLYKNIKYTSDFFKKEITILLFITLEMNLTLKIIWGSLNEKLQNCTPS